MSTSEISTVAEGSERFDPNATYDENVLSEAWRQHRPAAYAEYRRQWDEVPRTKTELDFPIHLDIETTTVCNLSCPMCPRTAMLAANTYSTLTDVGMMSREQYASIIDQGMEHGLKSIKLNYLGEPLAHKDIVWQVEYAKKKGVLDVMMNTNATLLRPTMSKALLEAGLDNLFVSFDAASPDLFEQQRVGTTIGRVSDNLFSFVKLRNAGYPHVQIRLSMVMYEDPIWKDQFEGIKTMWGHLVDGIGYGNYTERDPDLRAEYPAVDGFWCSQPFQRMFLKYNGDVTICCLDDKDELVLGNWHKTKLYDIWNSPEYKKIRRQHTEGNYYEIDICRKCHFPHQV